MVKLCDLCGRNMKDEKNNAKLYYKEKDKEIVLDICDECLKSILKMRFLFKPKAGFEELKQKIFGK